MTPRDCSCRGPAPTPSSPQLPLPQKVGTMPGRPLTPPPRRNRSLPPRRPPTQWPTPARNFSRPRSPRSALPTAPRYPPRTRDATTQTHFTIPPGVVYNPYSGCPFYFYTLPHLFLPRRIARAYGIPNPRRPYS